MIIAILGIVGYSWYTEIIPFGEYGMFTKPSPSMENLQQISNVISHNEQQIVYYSFHDVPEIPDKEIPIHALKKSLETWENNNPQLKFVQSENSNIEIRWQEFSSSTHTGLATCNSVLFGILSHCVLDISVGAKDCNGNFVQNDMNMVSNIIMHEIGHAFKIRHTNETGHLMYSTDSYDVNFDDKGFVIPERFEELFVGQLAILQQEKQLRNQIQSLDDKLSIQKSQYEQYLKEYQFYEGKTLSPQDYKIAQQTFEKLKIQTEKINDIIREQNNLIDQVNEIIYQLGCTPNFKIST
ncbi:MAG: matrixin family metalloprotease [Nitrosopumilus sp.]